MKDQKLMENTDKCIHDDLTDFKFLFKKLELKQLFRLEMIIKNSIRETAEFLEISEMDLAKMKHDSINKKSVVC